MRGRKPASSGHSGGLPRRWRSLGFQEAGTLAQLHVSEGTTVSAGDVLAELGAGDEELALQAAEHGLLAAQVQLAQAQATPASEDVRAAEAGVAAAQATLDSLRAAPTEADLEQAQLNLAQARDALWGAQAARDALGGSVSSGPAYEEGKARVAAAEIDVRLAEIAYAEVQAGPTPQELASAEADLAQAQATLAALLRGPAAEELRSPQASVGQAEVAVAQARADATRAQAARRIVAPFAGTVTSLACEEGQQVAAGAEVLVLADLTDLLVETVDLSELDVAFVHPEQPVSIDIHGFGMPILQGRVEAVSAQATVLAYGQGYAEYTGPYTRLG